jgi:hypothetical protein
MQNEKSLTEHESFEVISRMIKTAQNDIQDDSFYYLIWGWLVFAASTISYFLMQINYENSSLPWAILMPLGGIATGIYSYKQERKQKVRSYVDDVMKYVVISFLVSLFIVLFSMSKLGLSTYPLVMIIYGTWLFISGGAVKFQPLVLGGIINWILGIAAFFVEFEIQLLLLAGAVLLGYIVPGHMLKNRFKKHANFSQSV